MRWLFLGLVVVSCAHKPAVEMVFDPDRIGDAAQAHGVAFALESDPEPLPRPVFLGVGQVGIKKILEEPHPGPRLLVHMGHQWTSDHAKLMGHADIIALPATAVTEQIRSDVIKSGTLLVSTSGVAHNVTVAAVKADYERRKSEFPDDERFFVVILSGDFKNADGKTWTYFTSAQAQNLRAEVVRRVKNDPAHILVLNGPRTGMHDPATQGMNPGAHRGEMDFITREFVESLRTYGFEVTLFDFQYNQPSYYKATLGFLLEQPAFELMIPGDSVSMTTEVRDVFSESPTPIMVYDFASDGALRVQSMSIKTGRSAAQTIASAIRSFQRRPQVTRTP